MVGLSWLRRSRIAGTAAAVAGELVGVRRQRRCWTDGGRAWIEIRGVGRPGAEGLLEEVASAARQLSGVRWAETNRPLARLVVSLEPGGPSPAELTALLDEVEQRVFDQAGQSRPGRDPMATDLPGDCQVMDSRVVAVIADAAGLALASAGRVARWPRIPAAGLAAVALIDNQPRLRRVVERRLGGDAADVVLACANAAAQALAQNPAALLVDLGLRVVLVSEARALRRSWMGQEPVLAGSAACDVEPRSPARPAPLPSGVVERYADVAAGAGLAAAAIVAASTRRAEPSSTVLAVAAPRPARTARESFAATFSAGLAVDGALVWRPGALRLLDRVDALVLDPGALMLPTLAVAEIRGAEGSVRSKVWRAASEDVAAGLLGAGWHPAAALSPSHSLGPLENCRVLVAPERDPRAEAIVAAARGAQLSLHSLDLAELGSLRSAFDTLAPVTGSDESLTELVRQLQAAGRCVALVSARAATAIAASDLAIGLGHGAGPTGLPDVVVADLAGAWRVISAVPVARRVSRRGVELSGGGAVLGGLLALPGVRGRGPGPVTAAAAAALIEGRLAGRRAARRPPPASAPAVTWHAMTVEQSLDRGRRLRAERVTADATAPQQRSAGESRRVREALLALARFGAVARRELSDPLTPVLAVGAAASAVLGAPVDAALVASVMGANGVLSSVQRLRAEHQLRRLLVTQTLIARRLVADAQDRSSPDTDRVEAAELAAGDVIRLLAGDVVPADARLVDTNGIEVDESSLTGEALPVSKDVEPTPGTVLAERRCMLFEGTTVLTGDALAVVTAVGSASAAGRAAALTPGRHRETGLQTQLASLTSRVLPVTAAAGAAVGLTSLLRGAGIRRAVTSGVSIAVAAVPEGLPLVATLAQQAAARRLAGHGILVRSPRAVEALGRVDVVCFDKTGTLSQNRLQVNAMRPGDGVSPSELLDAAAIATPAGPQALLHATDAAILDAAHRDVPTRDYELAFRPGRSFAAGIAGSRLAVKGAPERVLASCDMSAAQRAAALADAERLARCGLRVLAVAQRPITAQEREDAGRDGALFEQACGQHLSPLGLLGLADSARPGAAALIQGLARRDISVRIVTGDHPLTAAAIAGELGLDVDAEHVVSGAAWEVLSLRERRETARTARVFARMSPEQKVEIVDEIQRNGSVCAMVGDGANDAAAIRAAAIGVGVSSHGSDPARGAADVVLTDARVGSLLPALDEGRQMWSRVQGALGVLLGGNAGEVAFTLYGTALTGNAPLNPRQLLLVNMLTDALPAAAVAVAPREDAHPATTRGLDKQALVRTILTRGATTTLGASTAWTMARLTGRRRRAATVGLVALVSTQLAQTLLESRSPLVVVTAAGSLVALGAAVSTPGVSHILGCTPLGPLGWAQALGSAGGATALAAIAPNLARRLPDLPHNVRDAGTQQDRIHAANGRQQKRSEDRRQVVGSKHSHAASVTDTA